MMLPCLCIAVDVCLRTLCVRLTRYLLQANRAASKLKQQTQPTGYTDVWHRHWHLSLTLSPRNYLFVPFCTIFRPSKPVPP